MTQTFMGGPVSGGSRGQTCSKDCGLAHSDDLTCRQAKMVSEGVCSSCRFAHGGKTCTEAQMILARNHSATPTLA